MTYDQLRVWVVTRSLGCAAISFAVFLLAPTILPEFGITMRWDQAWKYMQISLPVLLGYVASAVAFLLGQSNTQITPGAEPSPLLVTVAKASFYFYLAAFLAVVIVYGYSNRPTAPLATACRARC